jgi:hypothetical protein
VHRNEAAAAVHEEVGVHAEAGARAGEVAHQGAQVRAEDAAHEEGAHEGAGIRVEEAAVLEAEGASGAGAGALVRTVVVLVWVGCPRSQAEEGQTVAAHVPGDSMKPSKEFD